MLSLCMIAKNEAKWLDQCLKSASKHVDEIIVVDTGSTDKTKEIAKKYTKKVYDFKWIDDFSAARNESLKHATKEWIIVLDADEIIADSDWKKIKHMIKDKTTTAYLFDQIHYTNDALLTGLSHTNGTYKEEKGYKRFYTSKVIRLFQNNPEIRYVYRVHETPGPNIKRIKGIVKDSDIPIHHYGYADDNKKFNDKMHWYLSLDEKQIKLTPDNPKPYFEAGLIHKALSNYSKAEDYFKKVVKINPKFKDAYVELGQIYLIQEKYKSALNAFLESVKYYPKNEVTYLSLSYLLMKLSKIDQALDSARRAEQLNPTNIAVKNQIIKLMIIKKDYSTANEMINAILKKDPDNIDGINSLGEIHFRKGEYEKTITLLKKAISIYPKLTNPKIINLYVNLANTFNQLGRKNEAVNALDKAIKLNPPGVEKLKAMQKFYK